MFLTILIFNLKLAHAAACCGGGFAAPAVIAGDERATLGASLSQTTIDTDVDGSGYWRGRGDARETNETLRLDGAHLLSDRWQLGAALPFVRRTSAAHAQSGLGDLALNLGYEALTDWDYSPWQPKGLLFAQLVAPTGMSAYDATDLDALEARGRGFWTLGLGMLLAKVRGQTDLVFTLGVHHAWPRTHTRAGQSERLTPGWGGTLATGMGYSFGPWRLGGALEWMYEDPVVATTAGARAGGSAERLTTASLSANYLFNLDWALGFTYADQTWFGAPNNTALGRGLSLNLQRRWAR